MFREFHLSQNIINNSSSRELVVSWLIPDGETLLPHRNHQWRLCWLVTRQNALSSLHYFSSPQTPYLLWWSFSSAPSPRCASHLSHFGRCIIISNTKGAGNLCWRARKARESETQRIYGKEVLTEGLAEEELHSRDTALGGKTTW